VSDVAKVMGMSNAVEEITCKGLQRLLPCSHQVGDELGAAAIASAMTGASASERPAKQVSERARTRGALGRSSDAQIR